MENIKKVFLGGTCNESTWREKLIPMLKKDFFNPIVKDWTPECQEEERRQKSFVCDAQLYVITPKMIGVFSIAEVTDASNKTPDSTILCILKEDDEDDSFNNGTIKSLEAVKNLVKSNGAHVFNSLEEVAMFINNN